MAPPSDAPGHADVRTGSPTAARSTPHRDGPGHLRATALLTDGLAGCLTADVLPSFSWHLALADGGDPALALQTGYELAVEDARGVELWTSGPVASTAQRGIRYEGPTLDDDADYAWRVQVRDAAGVPGAWSAPEPFSTGLTGAAWEADWIRRAPGGRAPLEILNGALRVAGSPFLPIPVSPIRSFRLQARLRPVMGWAGLVLRSTGPGTGLLLELNAAGDVVLRPAPAWEIPAPGHPRHSCAGARPLGPQPANPPGAAAREGFGLGDVAGPGSHR